jgi:hypothetical protein
MLNESARNGRRCMRLVDATLYYRLFSCKLQATWFLANTTITTTSITLHTYESDQGDDRCHPRAHSVFCNEGDRRINVRSIRLRRDSKDRPSDTLGSTIPVPLVMTS